MKDLAKEYAVKEYKRLANNAHVAKDNKCFTFEDIKTAFNAGRGSILKNIPKLRWIDGGDATKYDYYVDGCYARTHFGIYSVLCWMSPTNIAVCLNGDRLDVTAKNVNQAKILAEEDYKMRVNQMLGL